LIIKLQRSLRIFVPDQYLSKPEEPLHISEVSGILPNQRKIIYIKDLNPPIPF